MKKTIDFVFTDAQIQKATDAVYAKNASNYKVQGFRPGKAPRKVIEQNYGPVFVDEALSNLFNDAFKKYLDDNPDFRPVDDPQLKAKPNKDGSLNVTAEVEYQAPFALGKYTGLEIKKIVLPVTDVEINKYLDRVAHDRTREIATGKDHPIENGNIAVIDFVGSVDGVEFPGGTGKNHELEIGSHSFIDNFEEQLIGAKIGDKIDVNVTFPKDYHAKELAGKKALFKVEIRNVLRKEIPAIDDNLAKESSEFDNLEDFKKDIRKNLEKQSSVESERINDDEMLRVIVEQTKIDVHPKVVEHQYEHATADFEESLSKSGITLDMYLEYMNISPEQYEKDQREAAEIGAKTGLVLDAIARKEGIKDFRMLIEFLRKNNTFKESD